MDNLVKSWSDESFAKVELRTERCQPVRFQRKKSEDKPGPVGSGQDRIMFYFDSVRRDDARVYKSLWLWFKLFYIEATI